MKPGNQIVMIMVLIPTDEIVWEMSVSDFDLSCPPL